MLETLLLDFEGVRELLEQADCEDEQVVEVHGVGRLLFLDVALADLLDFFGPVVKLVVAGGDDLFEGAVRSDHHEFLATDPSQRVAAAQQRLSCLGRGAPPTTR